MSTEIVLTIDHLSKTFERGRRVLSDGRTNWAVNDVSLTLARGETLGLVGESGSGKSTLARCVLQLIRPTRGAVLFDDTDLTRLRGRSLSATRARIGLISQDPYSALNPRWNVEQIVRHPLTARGVGTGGERRAAVTGLIAQVGLPASYASRYPAQLSGGERQRVAIARALALDPSILLCDEPTSALDVSVQAQILNLLMEIQSVRQVSLLFISHDMAVVRRMSHRVAIMSRGEVVEIGDVDQVFEHGAHEYTRALLAAVPELPG
jgi:peptide/nickel transport system ATP-binding protein